MQISEIPQHIGLNSSQFADLMGVKKQALQKYLDGSRGKKSAFINDMLAVSNLNMETIVFPDRFDHPDGENPEQPQYWINIAIEAIFQASQRGLDPNMAQRISDQLVSHKLDNTNLLDNIVNAIGNPNFNPDAVIEALRPHSSDGSVLAVINSLSDWAQQAKKLY